MSDSEMRIRLDGKVGISGAEGGVYFARTVPFPVPDIALGELAIAPCTESRPHRLF